MTADNQSTWVTHGKLFELICPFIGKPYPTVRWTKVINFVPFLFNRKVYGVYEVYEVPGKSGDLTLLPRNRGADMIFQLLTNIIINLSNVNGFSPRKSISLNR